MYYSYKSTKVNRLILTLFLLPKVLFRHPDGVEAAWTALDGNLRGPGLAVAELGVAVLHRLELRSFAEGVGEAFVGLGRREGR